MAHYLKKSSFPIAVVILLVAAIFTLHGETQQPKSISAVNDSSGGVKTIRGVAVAFAVSDAVRDLPDVDLSNSELLNNDEGAEKNPDNVELAKSKRALLASRPQTKPIPSFDAAIRGNSPSPNLPAAPIAN